MANQRRDEDHISGDVGDETQNQIDESSQIAQALQMQMEVQRKLNEQIEVQKHLQLRIEAQGKYLQSVLMKARETLSGYKSSSVGVELAKAELSQLVSMVDSGCPSSSSSGLTDMGGPSLRDSTKNPTGGTGCSLEGPLTSSESSRLIDLHPWPKEKVAARNQINGRKRRGSTISDGNYAEQPAGRGSMTQTMGDADQLRKFGLVEAFDLNKKYLSEFDSGPKAIDLN
ncbi:hypothetical protein U1Q18_016866 [Sarracenia purpurea var. burkii]